MQGANEEQTKEEECEDDEYDLEAVLDDMEASESERDEEKESEN